jgi:Mrp family chromosome partitioning ATPase
MIDDATGLEYMPVGHVTQTPQHILSSVACDGLFSHLRTQYDFVVLDAPPVLPVSDALIMERLADVTLFVVRWGATPRALVQSAFRKLRRNVKSHLCVVLSRVDLRKHASYGFGDVGYAPRPMDGRYRRPEQRHARRAAS